jgi:hypothetical protein
VLIEALRDILPPDIPNRHKRGFSLPQQHWMETDLKPLVEDTCSRRAIASRGILDPDLAVMLPKDNNGALGT